MGKSARHTNKTYHNILIVSILRSLVETPLIHDKSDPRGYHTSDTFATATRRPSTRVSLWATILTVVTFLTLYFAFPDYLFNVRPKLEDAIGKGPVYFIEGFVVGAVVTTLVLEARRSSTNGRSGLRSARRTI